MAATTKRQRPAKQPVENQQERTHRRGARADETAEGLPLPELRKAAVEPKPVLNLGNLAGPDGNGALILGKAMRAAQRAGWSDERVEALLTRTRSGDYQNLLAVIKEEFDCVVERVEYKSYR